MIERVAPSPASRRPAAGTTRPLSSQPRPHRFSAALLRRLDGVWVELMLDDQNERIARLDSAPDGTPPVTVVGDRLVPAAHLDPELAQSVERWSGDRAFRAMVKGMWSATPSSEPAPAAPPAQPLVTSLAEDTERDRRWAAAYRERLMLASDATKRWDRQGRSGGVRQTLEHAHDPSPARSTPAAQAAARHAFGRGRGG